MNEICKQRIRERLLDALKKEKISTSDAGRSFKMLPNYLSMVKNPRLWSNVSEEKWDILQKWCNSGKSITEYGKNDAGVVASENVASLRNTDKADKMIETAPAEEVKPEGWHIPTKKDMTRIMETVHEMPGMGQPDSIPEKSVSEPEKSVPELAFTVNAGNLGWILQLLGEKHTVEFIVDNTHVTPHIVKLLKDVVDKANTNATLSEDDVMKDLQKKKPVAKKEALERVSDAKLVFLLMEEKYQILAKMAAEQKAIDSIDVLLDIYTK